MKILDFKELPDSMQDKVWVLYEGSFPGHERRSRNAQLAALSDERAYSKIIVGEQDEIMALAFYWLHTDFVYVEFLAVNPAMRGQNIGTEAVEGLLEPYPGKLAILEIEPPEDDMTIRRRRFYERLGFVLNPCPYTHPSYYTGENAHPHRLSLMTRGRRITETEFGHFTDFMKETVLSYSD